MSRTISTISLLVYFYFSMDLTFNWIVSFVFLDAGVTLRFLSIRLT